MEGSEPTETNYSKGRLAGREFGGNLVMYKRDLVMGLVELTDPAIALLHVVRYTIEEIMEKHVFKHSLNLWHSVMFYIGSSKPNQFCGQISKGSTARLKGAAQVHKAETGNADRN